jgi:hypothetical protein
MSEDPNHQKILKLLAEKILLKQEVFEKTKGVFYDFKKSLAKLAADLKETVKDLSKDVLSEYRETADLEAEFTLGDETLLFAMHTNIFTFDSNHPIWRNKYVIEDSRRAFCGKIFIYNFLSDSFKYNRSNDLGYLIARIFVNREGHFFVEGKKQLNYLYSDFSSSILDQQRVDKIIESAVLYSLDFDPFTPPFETISDISVREVIEAGLQNRIATGKRLGFQFEAEGNIES